MQKEIRVPSDIITGTLHYVGEYRFPADVPKIHRVFYELSQDQRFSSLFRDFVFDTSGSYPYTPTLRYALDELQSSHLLKCLNPGLDEYEVSEELAKDPNIEELFGDDEKKILKEMADEFKKIGKK